MIFVLASIRHTGTQLVRGHIFRDWPKHLPHGEIRAERTVIHGHIDEKWEGAMHAYAGTGNVVIPLRRIEKIIVSWERRSLDLARLERALERLEKRWDRYLPYYIPVDHGARDLYVDDINRDCWWAKLESNWPIIGSERGSVDATINDVNDKHFYDRMVKRFGPFFTRIYGQH